MSSPRDAIKTIRDYERFLRARGFTGTESRILARSYRDLEPNKGARGEGGPKDSP